MKFITVQSLLILCTQFILASALLAQVPQKMSFQAVIRNSNNQLISNQNLGVRVSILQGNVTGNAVYTETHNTNSNDNGIISIEIGNGNPTLGSFANINWSAGPYFVKTETDLQGGSNYTLVATQQLLSVPYAMYAATSGSSIPGPQGPAGIGISSTQVVNDSLIVSYNNGQVQNAGKVISDNAIQQIVNNNSGLAVDTMVIYSTPGTYVWTVPQNVKKVLVECWGGGGGAASSGQCTFYCGYGNSTRGQGGGYATSLLSVTPLQQITITVGAGGQNGVQYGGGCCSVITPTIGGNSSFGNQVIAIGGGAAGQELSGGTGQFILKGEPGVTLSGQVQTGGSSPRGGLAGEAPGGGGRYRPSNEGNTNHGGAPGMVLIRVLH